MAECTLEYELKYIIPAHRLSPVLAFINSKCLPDESHPTTRVSSIYFDDLNQTSLYEKVNSDFLKCKVRLRWYDSAEVKPGAKNAFFELKRKIGSQRTKQRVGITLDPEFLIQTQLSDQRFVQLATQVANQDNAFQAYRFPSLTIQYDRTRCIDPLSGCRISIDTNIRVPRVNQQVMPAARPAAFHNAVIEIKGNSPEMPFSLSPIQRFGVRKTSYSKYLCGYAHANRIIFDPR